MDELPSNSILVRNVHFEKLQEELKKVKGLMKMYVTKMAIHTTNIPPKLVQLERRIMHLEEGERINKEYIDNVYKRVECLENVFEFVSDNKDLFKHFNNDSDAIIKKITEKKSNIPELLSNLNIQNEQIKDKKLPLIKED